jgi:hypothetical protein
MAHFAEIDENNIVINVVVVPDEQQDRGQEFLSKDLKLGGRWIQTSYNTYGGIHYDSKTGRPSKDQSKALRKNYAGIGHRYDETLDAFVPPKPIDRPSYMLNPVKGWWEPPIPEPEPKEGGRWFWAELEQEWFWFKDAPIDDEML